MNRFNVVIFPSLVPLVGERIFLTEDFQFFIDILINLINERDANPMVKENIYNGFRAIAVFKLNGFSSRNTTISLRRQLKVFQATIKKLTARMFQFGTRKKSKKSSSPK